MEGKAVVYLILLTIIAWKLIFQESIRAAKDIVNGDVISKKSNLYDLVEYGIASLILGALLMLSDSYVLGTMTFLYLFSLREIFLNLFIYHCLDTKYDYSNRYKELVPVGKLAQEKWLIVRFICYCAIFLLFVW